MNEDDPDFTAGFNREFEELGEHAVRRRLGDFTPGKRPMAADWLDRKAAERERAQALAVERAEIRADQAESRTKLAQTRAERAEQRADKQLVVSKLSLVVSILAIVATIIVAFVTSHIR
jgi:hypothetical protein